MRCRGVEATDVTVTQPVEHQGEQLAGGGDLADGPAAAGGDAVTVGAQLPVVRQDLDSLDRGPTHQPRTLFRHVPADHRGVDA